MTVNTQISNTQTPCCAPVFGDVIDGDEASQLADRLKVLADPSRLRLLSVLFNCDEFEACVCDVTEPMGLTQPTVSHHLKALNEAGFVTRERRGQWVYYRVVPEMVETVRAALAIS